jgi:hypothetical protein
MATQTFETYAISGNSYSTEMPIYPTRGGKITVDADPGELFFQLRCGTGGNLIVEGKAGNPIYYPSVFAGETLVTCGRRVLSAATVDGEAVTTTADDIYWYGGK